jgi:hypothetical protein
VLGTVLVANQAAATVPPTLAVSTIKAADTLLSGQTLARVVPAHVVKLTKGVLTTMFITRVKMVAALVCAVSLLAAGAGALAGAARTDRETPPAPATVQAGKQALPVDKDAGDTLTVRGRVLDPDGKPIAGARLYQGPTERTTSNAEGQFQFRVPRSDFPVQIVAAADGFGLGWVKAAQPQATGDLTLKLVKDVPIAGRILDPEGRPIVGAIKPRGRALR